MKIITGEKIQQLCDIYLGFNEDFNFNPVIEKQKNKHYNLQYLNGPFNNPSLIFCYPHRLNEFVGKIQFFCNPFVLITHNSDFNITNCDTINKILNNNKVEKWYAQNLCYKHNKLHLLPIGIANSQWPHGNINIFNNIDCLLHKTKNIYFQFNVHTNYHKRQLCYNSLINKLEWLNPTNPLDNIKRLQEYKFCICPEGNGVDTHRLWEALYLKVVPIVINSDFIQILASYNVPLVILNNWEDLVVTKLNYNDYNFNDDKFIKLLNFTNLQF